MDSVKKIKKVFAENSDGKIVLPNFQRGFEWKVNDQKKLLSTVLSLLPIGSILLLEGKKGDFSTRQLCYIDDKFVQLDECLYLLDGQQRMSTLRALFSDLLGNKGEWLSNYENLYKDLRYRWFIDVKKTDTVDIFGYEKLIFKDKSIIKYEPGQFIESIVELKITKQNKSEWYHPDFNRDEAKNELDGNKLKNLIAKHSSEAGLIPLYDIYNAINKSEKSLLEYTLEKIAFERVNKLKAEVADGENSIVELLSPVNADIEDLIENEEVESINFAWSTLATDWKKDMLNYLTSLLEQEMHVIQLPADEISRATAIFESINRGGISLNTFDLVVAKAARIRSEKTLTQKIGTQLKEEMELSNALTCSLKGKVKNSWSSINMNTIEDNKVANTIRDQFLNLLSIFSHTNYGEIDQLKIDLIKKDKQLSITPDQINSNTDITIKSILRGCAFLQYRVGKININDLNYKLMLLPIAYALRSDKVWNSKEGMAKIEYWYWSSLFGGAYREKQNQRCIEDIGELYEWINAENDSDKSHATTENPFKNRYAKILNNEGYSTLEVLLNKDADNNIPLAIHNGILEYVLSTQPKDFNIDKEVLLNTWDIAVGKIVEHNETTARNLKVEDHHIYPLGAVLTIGQSSREIRSNPKHILNSPLNRTYISDYANMLIRDKSPGQYFNYLTNTTVWTHSIDDIEWRENPEEINNEFYESILTNRYNKIYQQVLTELEDLERISD